MRMYASSRVKRKSFYRKSDLQMFLFISGGHIGAPKLYTNMASPYKALQRCVKIWESEYFSFAGLIEDPFITCPYGGGAASFSGHPSSRL